MHERGLLMGGAVQSDDETIERHHFAGKERLIKKFGKRKYDRRIRAVADTLRILLGSEQAFLSFMSQTDDQGFPIGDNPQNMAAEILIFMTFKRYGRN
jgi:hypothetical protein